MDLEELKKMRLISNTTGRPTILLTDKKWQNEFAIRKMFIIPYKKARFLCSKNTRESYAWNEETMGIYHGKTMWQQYCSFINDILRNIRNGKKDYCYFMYQVLDIAKFHLSDLQTRYCDGYWEVWLNVQKGGE